MRAKPDPALSFQYRAKRIGKQTFAITNFYDVQTDFYGNDVEVKVEPPEPRTADDAATRDKDGGESGDQDIVIDIDNL